MLITTYVNLRQVKEEVLEELYFDHLSAAKSFKWQWVQNSEIRMNRSLKAVLSGSLTVVW